MMKSLRRTIGIPGAISYYNNFPFYYGFFTGLGLNVIVSDKTTKAIINIGSKHVVSETCLPVKVYVGHVLNLLEKNCDAIFVPSIQSLDYKVNNCSKIRGLPEIIRNVVDEEFLMIEPTLDKTEKKGFKDFCFEAAHQLGITDKKLILSAIKSGWKVYDNFLKMANAGVSFDRACDFAVCSITVYPELNPKKYEASVVVTGHGYNLFDDGISMGLLKKLEKLNVKAYTSLNLTENEQIKSIRAIGGRRYWANELELTGTSSYYLLKDNIDGVISLSAFGCGPDSLMVDDIYQRCKERNKPFLHLIIDEHTGEAGFLTRLEAFVDMLIRKKRKMSLNVKSQISEQSETKSVLKV